MSNERPQSAGRRAAFITITLLSPLIFFVALEGMLRIVMPGLPLFEHPSYLGPEYLAPSGLVGARYFPGDPAPPSPPNTVFRATKPRAGFRVAVLGESTTAGFPFPYNGAFSDVLADALKDVLPPTDTVEVINLGIAATNSFAIADIVGEVIAQQPDAVLIYAGHNEYYGAYGVASRQRLLGSPAFVRTALRLQRLRTVALLRRIVASMNRSGAGGGAGCAPRVEWKRWRQTEICASVGTAITQG